MNQDTLILILMGIEIPLMFFITVILPILLIAFIAYKLIKKLSHDHVEYQYRYQQYKEDEATINSIEADLKRHQEEGR